MITPIYIYKITNPEGCIYVGQTISPKKRTYQYKRVLNTSCQPKISESILKYGWGNHQFEIIEKCHSSVKANTREIFWIKKLNSYFKFNDKGLNLTTGGRGTRRPDPFLDKKMPVTIFLLESEIAKLGGLQAAKDYSYQLVSTSLK
jgi:hypothetical protein